MEYQRAIKHREAKTMAMMESPTWHRRSAVQIAAQLPDNREDALRVLELTRELAENFLFKDDGCLRPASPAAVLAFPLRKDV
jgi:hypothetical protein